MKTKKWMLTAGVVLSTAVLLVACGKADKEADAPTTFSYVYGVDPSSFGLQYRNSYFNNGYHR